MKTFFELLLLLTMATYIYSQCTCEQIPMNQDCVSTNSCKWTGTKECQPLQCIDFESEVECENRVFTPLGTEEEIRCYWTGKYCRQLRNCLDYYFEEINFDICDGLGCGYDQGSLNCRELNCTDFDYSEEVCNEQTVGVKPYQQQCYWDKNCKATMICDEIKNKISCEKYYCLWKDETCQDHPEPKEYPCDKQENLQQCYMIGYEKDKVCIWDDVAKCYAVTQNPKCSEFQGRQTCPSGFKGNCKWDEERFECLNKVCADYECTKLEAHLIQGTDIVLFCDQDKDTKECVKGDQNNMKTDCFQGTKFDREGFYYVWNNSTCIECKNQGQQMNLMIGLMILCLLY